MRTGSSFSKQAARSTKFGLSELIGGSIVLRTNNVWELDTLKLFAYCGGGGGGKLVRYKAEKKLVARRKDGQKTGGGGRRKGGKEGVQPEQETAKKARYRRLQVSSLIGGGRVGRGGGHLHRPPISYLAQKSSLSATARQGDTLQDSSRFSLSSAASLGSADRRWTDDTDHLLWPFESLLRREAIPKTPTMAIRRALR